MKPSKELSEILVGGIESAGLGLHERKAVARLLASECSSDLHDDFRLETRGLSDVELFPKDNVISLSRSIARDAGKNRSI